MRPHGTLGDYRVSHGNRLGNRRRAVARYCRNPAAHWTEIHDEQLAVKASAGVMKRIRDQVRQELTVAGEQQPNLDANRE
jgi:hypothetical protein